MQTKNPALLVLDLIKIVSLLNVGGGNTAPVAKASCSNRKDTKI